MKIAMGSDHGGFDIKEAVKEWLTRRGIEVEDVGCYSKQSVDYPDYAREVAYRVSHNTVDQGVLVCTTGLGMAIAANPRGRPRMVPRREIGILGALGAAVCADVR